MVAGSLYLQLLQVPGAAVHRVVSTVLFRSAANLLQHCMPSNSAAVGQSRLLPNRDSDDGSEDEAESSTSSRKRRATKAKAKASSASAQKVKPSTGIHAITAP